MFKHKDISLRAVEEKDLQLLYKIRYDEVVNEQLFSIFPLSMSIQNEWLESMLKSLKYKVFMIENDEFKTIGCVRLNDIDHLNRKVEVGADVQEIFRGKGYGKKIYELLFKYCFDCLNMNKMYLYVFEDNSIAITLYKKVGFKEEGKLCNHVYRNGWKNVLIMCKFNEVKK